MKYVVSLTDHATQDLEQIYHYIYHYDQPKKADDFLQHIEKILNTLIELPERGSFPKELFALGIKEYREIYFKVYRIIYKLSGKKIYILLIADGRRDLQTLLEQRLFS